MKKYSECKTVQDWIKFYNGASKSELKAVLKSIGNPRTLTTRNQKDACVALLA